MLPANFKGGCKGEQIRFAVGDYTLGAILIAATEQGVCAILLGDHPECLDHDLENRFPHANLMARETASYGQIANRIGSTGAARAVAGACAANPLAVAVPGGNFL